MKKALLIFLAFLLQGLLPALAQFSYNTNADGSSITITGYTGVSGSVTIPTNINGFAVNAIGAYVFDAVIQADAGLTNVVIPDSVTSIGDSAFYRSPVTSITLSRNITNLGETIFFYASLTSVTIPNGLTNLGYAMFEGCTNLTNVVFPNSVIGLGELAFASCGSLSNITLPDNIISIPMSAFSQSGLTSIAFPSNVTSIGAYAFDGCPLTNITISSRITNVGAGAFAACTNLTAITVDEQNPVYRSVNGVLFDKAQTTLVQYPAGLGGSYAIPGTVGNIGEASFGGCVNLNLTIPNSVTNIEAYAFEESFLTNIDIPGSITTIGEYAFQHCLGLAKMTIPASVTTMALSAFEADGISLYFMGNAPVFSFTGFLIFLPSSSYYLPGSTGWGLSTNNPFAFSATLWNPQIQTGDGSFGVRNGQFGFNIIAPQIYSLVVETCTNLTNPLWTPLATVILPTSNGPYYFSDPQWTNNPSRYYRLGLP